MTTETLQHEHETSRNGGGAPAKRTKGGLAPVVFAANEGPLIKWPAWEDLKQVSEQLARIQRAGMRSEGEGDHFRSGDLAYQIQEILRATAELCKKSERTQE